MPPTTPSDLLADVLRRDPSSPLLTWYDDRTGERIELSGTTVANWVAKTANLLQEEFDVGPGSTVAVALPVHWQTAAVLLGAWSCGATVLDTAGEDDGRLTDVDVTLTSQDRVDALAEAGAEPLLGLSLHPLGLGMTDYAGDARDFALEVRVHGDVFAPWQPVDPQSTGLRAGGVELTLSALVTTAGELGGRLGLRPGDRLLVDPAAAAELGPVAWLLMPLAAGASVVLSANTPPADLARRAASEHVTATLGVALEGIRELGRSA